MQTPEAIGERGLGFRGFQPPGDITPGHQSGTNAPTALHGAASEDDLFCAGPLGMKCHIALTTLVRAIAVCGVEVCSYCGPQLARSQLTAVPETLR